MGSRWRIRHKLLLGVGLVVAIMALLLSGTLTGLWSYYSSTNSIRAKLAEKEAADEFRAGVEKITAPGHLSGLIGAPNRLPEELGQLHRQLTAYQDRLQETLENGHDPSLGIYEGEMIAQLEEDLVHLRQVLLRQAAKPTASSSGDPDHERRELKDVQKPVARLRQNAQDLCVHLKEVLARRLLDSRRAYQIALWIIVPSSIVGLAIMVGLLRSFYAWVFHPIRDLATGVSRVAGGDLGHRIDLHSGDEMEELARAFNDMMGRLQDLYGDLARQVNERSRQLVRAERLASVGFLAAGVAHEINNPLASIAFCSEALEARLNELLRNGRLTTRVQEDFEVFVRYLRMIQQESFRCKNITERLLAFSRTGERRREPIDLRELVQSVLDVMEHQPNHKGKEVMLEIPGEVGGVRSRITAWAHGEEIKSVVLNLVINALESMEVGGRLTIRLGQRHGLAEIQFIDNGCGMTQEVLDNIFEPFFTRSRTGKGTGLGLTISHLVVSQHGGEIEATSPGPGQGSTFIVRLPVQPAETAGTGAPLARAA